MASHTVTVAEHATLSTTTADTISFNGGGLRSVVQVKNRSGATTLYVTTDGTTAVAEADGTRSVLAGSAETFHLVSQMSIVGNGNAYSVEVVLA